MISTNPIMTKKEIEAAIKNCVNNRMTPWYTVGCKGCLLRSVCQPLKGKKKYYGQSTQPGRTGRAGHAVKKEY